MTPTSVIQESAAERAVRVGALFVGGIEYRLYDNLYSVSSDGRVLRRGEPAVVRLRPDGYLEVGRRRLLHRVVATCWVDRPSEARLVHHMDGDKANNNASNLEWVTPVQHMGERHLGTSAGHTMSEAGKEKLRQLRTGSKTSEATKQKQREAAIRLGCKPPPRPVGTKCSVEAIEKMRRNNPMNTACEVFGVTYPSFAQAARALGQKLHTLRQRCLSENFPDYKLLK